MAMTLEVPVCANPSAPVVACVVCGQPVHTCERAEPVVMPGGSHDYVCPVHPDGSEVSQGNWTCSGRCYETWEILGEAERLLTESRDGTPIDAADRDRLLGQIAEWRSELPVLVAPPDRSSSGVYGLHVVPKSP